MKNHLLSFATCVAAIMFASCSKEDAQQPNLSQETTIEVSITAELDEFAPTTKATAEACIRLKWEGDETVYAYSESSDGTLSAPAALTASISDNAYVAVLKGTITAPTDADKTLYLVYSPSGTLSISDHTLTVPMNGTQSSDKVPFVAYAKLTGVTGTDYQTDGLQAKFSFASSVINVNVTGLGSGVSLSTATMTGLAPNCTITLGSTIEVGKSGDETTYNKTLSGSATTGGKAQFFLAVPEMAASSSRVLTVTDGNGGKYTESGVVAGAHSANSYVNTICCVKESLLLPGKFTVNASGKQVQFTRGNLYYSTTDGQYHIEAAQNVTYATLGQSAYDSTHVCHFFWSNTTDWQTSGKEPWAKSYSNSAQSTSDKFFCGIDNPMTVGGQSGLYALTGGGSGEWNYLFNSRSNAADLYTVGVSVTIGDKTVSNCVVIAPDSCLGGYTFKKSKKSYTASEWSEAESAGLVCLPAAGSREGSDLYDAGSIGYYWSATPYEGYEDDAYSLDFFGSNASPAGRDLRDYGNSVRLVGSVSK